MRPSRFFKTGMKKKLIISLALLSGAVLLMGAAVIGYQDWQLRGSAPGNPASGYLRTWADNTAGAFKCLTSAGAGCYWSVNYAGTYNTGTLPVANGGTGVTSAQGNGSKVQLSSGSTTTDDCVKFDANGNTVDAGAACGSGGGGGTFPLTIVQEVAVSSGTSNVTSFTVTFPSALASSGNTAFMLVAGDGSSTVTAPTGWTVDLNVTQATYARFMLVHKATAGETSATFTVASASSFAIYFFEVTGSHSLDQSSTGGISPAGTVTNIAVVFPAITPTANSAVFGMATIVTTAGLSYDTSTGDTIAPNWGQLGFAAPATGGRGLFGKMSRVAATATSTQPPVLSFPSTQLFSGGGLAYATFSIL
jgi:hypothetical protein